MVTLSKKNKTIAIGISAIALILAVSLPYVFAAPVASNSEFNQTLRDLRALGIAVHGINGQKVKEAANFTLTLSPTETNATVKKFDVLSGTVNIDGVTYTISNGNGAVLTKRRLILLQATGTDSNGQSVTLKLAGRYFWMGGRLFVLRMVGKLQTNNGNYLLLMRAAIRV